MPKEYRTIQEVAGPLMMVRNVENVTYDELANGEVRRCKVLEVNGSNALVQLFEDSTGINLSNSKVRFLGRSMELGVSPDMLGRVFDGLGNPIDGGPDILPEERRDINGVAMNPAARNYPSEFIQTGISAIDGLNTLVRGQKLPIFSASGLPHANLAAQIAKQAKVIGTDEPFAVVFAAVGITFEESNFFINSFKETGAIDRTVLFINLANDPAVERIATPRMALTAAEYLAFEKGMHVLVIITDITNYADALREDHSNVMNQLFSAYARGKEAKELMTILGEAALSDIDLIYAKFADEFEKEYVSQGYDANRSIEETMDIGWKLLSMLPKSELKRIDDKFLEKYYKQQD